MALLLMIGGAAALVWRGFGWWPFVFTLFGALIVGGSIFLHDYPQIGKRLIIRRTRPLPRWIGALLILLMCGLIAFSAYQAWLAYQDGNSPDAVFFGGIVCILLWVQLKEWRRKAPVT